MGKLRSWEDNLSPLVRCTEENLAGDRGVGELHMAQNQVCVLNRITTTILTEIAIYTCNQTAPFHRRQEGHCRHDTKRQDG